MQEIGTDILYIPRLENIIKENPYFIKKVYTDKEIELAEKSKKSLYFYATRFAAKEAIIKATNGLYDFKEIEILKEKSGKPLPKIINNSNVHINLSLSYDNDYVVAFCTISTKKSISG